jgi:hypothetical protein
MLSKSAALGDRRHYWTGRRSALRGYGASAWFLALCLTALVVTSASASAAPAWLSPMNLSEAGQNASKPQVAFDSQGDAVAVWQRHNGSQEIVQASVRPVSSGTWQTPVNLSEAGQNASNSQVAFDSQGDAVAVWQRHNGSQEIVQASVRPAYSGIWQTPVSLSEAGQNASAPQVAFDSRGDAVAVWERENGSNQIVQASVRPASSGTWQAPVNLSETGWNSFEPQLAVDPEGDAVVVWRRTNGISGEFIQASVMPVSSGIWQAPVALSETGENAESPQVVFDSQGDATAVWQRYNGSNYIVQTSARPASSGTWQTPVSLSEAGQNASNPQVAFDSQCDAVAVWQRHNGSQEIVQASVRPASSGTWQTPVSLSEAGQNASAPQVALDPSGDALAVWQRHNGGQEIVQGAGYHGAGPLLNEVSIPISATAGQSLSFSVTPVDVWSALGETSWSFGDGSSAGGTSVAHTYASAGSYEVTLTSIDALGNTTMRKATVITVMAPLVNKEQSQAPEEMRTTGTPTVPSATTPARPVIELLTKAPQPLINTHSLRVRAMCSVAACWLSGQASIRLPGWGHALRLVSTTLAIAAGQTGNLVLLVPRHVRRAVRSYLRHHPGYKASIDLSLTVMSGGHASQTVGATLPIWTKPHFR